MNLNKGIILYYHLHCRSETSIVGQISDSEVSKTESISMNCPMLLIPALDWETGK